MPAPKSRCSRANARPGTPLKTSTCQRSVWDIPRKQGELKPSSSMPGSTALPQKSLAMWWCAGSGCAVTTSPHSKKWAAQIGLTRERVRQIQVEALEEHCGSLMEDEGFDREAVLGCHPNQWPSARKRLELVGGCSASLPLLCAACATRKGTTGYGIRQWDFVGLGCHGLSHGRSPASAAGLDGHGLQPHGRRWRIGSLPSTPERRLGGSAAPT